MDNQNPVPNPSVNPPIETPIQNQPIEQTPASQVYTAPHLDNPPSPKKPFMFSKILLPIVIIMVLLAATGGTYLALNAKNKPQSVAPKAIPTTAPTPLPTEASAKAGTPIDETANWKTYTNNNGFSIKYPASWIIMDTVVENLSCALLGKEIVKSMTICFSTEKFSNVWPEYINNPNKIKITINGYDAYENTISPGAFFVLNSNEQWANISPAGLSDKKLFDQILSTFRFDSP
ncbi:MAG: hypothetical protein A3H50_01190 [Candidatus Levybacteria bacterium RIFCSPLOWO2_02_FULL_37_10]|nr:MAG: hypothetical protein A3C97_01365 [Candidatus Levybacteria bacterium RIFCSPHIGHO2_02_FULL_37_11]OGH46149.1 MAG: hypothetical protein A3H50_01190 [Candidatus Levybacteria bacterium RIFCSPLOWO2_02_FULL_37_10]